MAVPVPVPVVTTAGISFTPVNTDLYVTGGVSLVLLPPPQAEMSNKITLDIQIRKRFGEVKVNFELDMMMDKFGLFANQN